MKNCVFDLNTVLLAVAVRLIWVLFPSPRRGEKVRMRGE